MSLLRTVPNLASSIVVPFEAAGKVFLNSAAHGGGSVAQGGNHIGDVFTKFFTGKANAAATQQAKAALDTQATELAKHLTVGADDAQVLAREILAQQHAATQTAAPAGNFQGTFQGAYGNNVHGASHHLPNAGSVSHTGGGGWFDNLFGNFFGGGSGHSLESLYQQQANHQVSAVLAQHQAAQAAKKAKDAAGLVKKLGSYKGLYDDPHLMASYVNALQTQHSAPLAAMNVRMAEAQNKMLGSQLGLQTTMMENLMQARIKAAEDMANAFGKIGTTP